MMHLMNTEFVLGLDLGTSSCKVSAVTLSGKILGSLHKEYVTQTPHSGWAEQQPEDWIKALSQASHALLERYNLDPGKARGLAITSAAHIAVLLDEAGEVIRPAILWNDQRSCEQAEQLSKFVGEKVFEQAGNWPSTTWSLPHLLWIQENDPDSWRKTHHILLSKDYIGYRLTGKKATDPAAAVSAMLYDVKSECWSPELCNYAGINMTWLPDVSPIGGELGKLSPAGAELLGLDTQVRVYNGTMDSTAETFAAGVRDEGDCVIRLASAGGLHGIARTPGFDRKLISYPYVVPGYWLSQAGTSTCAAAVSWAAKLFMDSTQTRPDFGAWSDLASESPAGSNGLMFHPYLMGERCPHWDPSLRGSFTGMGLHHTRGDVARAIYEGTAFSLLDASSALIARGSKVKNIKIVGGGGKSELWCQTLSNVFNARVKFIPGADSSYGAAIISLYGLGLYHSINEVPSDLLISGTEKSYEPDHVAHEMYSELFIKYKYVSSKLSEIAHFTK